MKKIIFTLSLFLTTFSFGQINIVIDTNKRVIPPKTDTISTPKIVRGVTLGEQSLIMYMESLPDDKFLRLVDKLVVGEIVYKKD